MTIVYKLLTVFLLVVCFVSTATAQSDNTPRAEFFGGFSVLRTQYEAEQLLPFIPVITFFDGKQTLNGFNVAATGYLVKGFGVTGDFSGNYTSSSLALSSGGSIDTKIRVYNILGGPQYKFRNSSRFSPFVRALAGVATTSATLSVPSLGTSDTASSTDFAMAIGGGLDIRVGDRIDLRVLQVDYNPIYLSQGNELGFGHSRADNVRFSFGVVIK